MKNSDTKQLTLPFDVLETSLEPQYAEIVKQNWRITFSKQYLTSVYAKRVMGLIASQIKKDGDVKEYYQITADKIINETGLQRAEIYKRMKNVVYEMAHVLYFLEDDKGHRVIPRHLLDTTRFENPAGYYNGVLTVAFNPQLKGIVKEMAHYAPFELNRYINFSSWYSMRLYELLEANKDLQYVEWNIENYRDWMGCGVDINIKTNKPKINKKTGKAKYVKYARHSDAILYTTQEPLKELKGTELEFTVTPIYAKAYGRGRPSIEKVRFDFIWQKKSPLQKITSWIEQSSEFKKVYERLKKYRVTDTVIAKYARTIGKKELNKLLHDWDIRQEAHSKNPIINPEKYCNKVLKDVAERVEKGN